MYIKVSNTYPVQSWPFLLAWNAYLLSSLRRIMLKWSICKASDAQLGMDSYGCGSPITATHTGILCVCACIYMYLVWPCVLCVVVGVSWLRSASILRHESEWVDHPPAFAGGMHAMLVQISLRRTPPLNLRLNGQHDPPSIARTNPTRKGRCIKFQVSVSHLPDYSLVVHFIQSDRWFSIQLKFSIIQLSVGLSATCISISAFSTYYHHMVQMWGVGCAGAG